MPLTTNGVYDILSLRGCAGEKDYLPIAVRDYVVPIYQHNGSVIVRRTGIDEVRIRYVFEGLHADGEHLIDATFGARNRDSVKVECRTGETILGGLLDLDDLIGWAIENGYLEARYKQ